VDRKHLAALFVIVMAFGALPFLASSSSAVETVDRVGGVDPAQGLWYLRGELGVTTFYYGNPGDYPILGDWDCNGTQTPGMYRQSDGFVYLRNSNSQGVGDVRFFFGNPGDIPLAGDFNGDGCDTVSIYRPAEARAFVINELGENEGGLGQADVAYFFGNPGDKPFVGDFDGDGLETVGLHRESTGLVYFRNSHTQGVADKAFIFGDPGDRLVAGDWNNDGTDSPALFRPANNTWYLRYTNTQGVADETIQWGQPAWLPVAGEFGVLIPTPTTTTTTVAGGTTFGDGRWLVPSEIAPGTYRNSAPATKCTWKRYSDPAGGFLSIIAFAADHVGQIVEIEPTDALFFAGGCGTWSDDLSPRKAPTASFGGGTWQVGSEVEPGVWGNAPAAAGCAWTRVSAFTREPNAVIDGYEVPDMTPMQVTVEATDVGFYASAECGTWTYLGP
jgi:hypothetical protein